MELEESRAEARRLMLEAGWTPIPKPQVWSDDYTAGTLVGGVTPDGLTQYVKDWAQVKPGDPYYSSDTPDEPHEAAAWLIAQFRPNPLTTEATLDPVALQSEEVENLQDESNGETGEASASGSVQDGDELGAGDELSVRLPAGLGELDRGAAESVVEDGDADVDYERAESDLIDADFTIEDLGGPDETLELPAPDPEDFAPEDFVHDPEPEAPQDRFIGLDDLDRRRSLRIGDTMRHANTLMPAWGEADHARLVTLRNFAMGVSEGRWNDDPAQSIELNALETTLRRINEIKEARDRKVVFLESADRDGVEGFVVEADWP